MAETMECGEKIADEFTEIEKLEKLFKITQLDDVINDNILHFVVPRWLHRFSKQFDAHSLKSVLYSTPVVPFKLMLLPHICQDLLQRYIKQHCPDCGVVQEEPALCLLRGKLCSPNWKSCCGESGC
ncbi:PREDICTED: E3 ubiquitin-protein ligase PRT6-like [Nicotiana attenuata]|nr:PREDICTED: E3 ubiquitin-protein ligase PRT6-like [Nicotiana attenuata]